MRVFAWQGGGWDRGRERERVWGEGVGEFFLSFPFVRSIILAHIGLFDLKATVHDIEDLVVLGKEMHVCPYYGTRSVIPQAEVSFSFSLSRRVSQLISPRLRSRSLLSPTISFFRSRLEKLSGSILPVKFWSSTKLTVRPSSLSLPPPRSTSQTDVLSSTSIQISSTPFFPSTPKLSLYLPSSSLKLNSKPTSFASSRV